MASQLKVDTLTGVTTAGSIVVTGEGNSTTTSLQQGLAKCWIIFGNDAVADDSLNIASTTDIGTGQWRQTKTNVMANTIYTVVVGTGYLYNDFNTGINSAGVESTSNHTQSKYLNGSGFQDLVAAGTAKQVIHGDLA